jgi:hypothetical protein
LPPNFPKHLEVGEVAQLLCLLLPLTIQAFPLRQHFSIGFWLEETLATS